MSYYVNDNLDNALQSFESALQRAPSEKKIRDNFVRTLRFRSTLSKENREHHKAITDLQKLATLANPSEKEKILKEIEQEQDIIFKQVEQANTIHAYESFVDLYPNSIFAEKAKIKIAKLTPKPSPNQYEVDSRPWPNQLEKPVKTKINSKVNSPTKVNKNSEEKMIVDSASPMALSESAIEIKLKLKKKKRTLHHPLKHQE